jgi:hypothetical protein
MDHPGRTLVKDSEDSAARSALEVPPEEMRRLGHRVVDLIVDRWVNLREAPAWQGGTRRELEPLLSGPPPEEGQDPDEVLRRVVEEILPRAGRIDHPRFFAFIPSSPTWPSVLGDLLATGFNVFQGTWLESAGPSQLELVVTDWFRSWLGLPEQGGGILTSGGSAANLGALVTARPIRFFTSATRGTVRWSVQPGSSASPPGTFGRSPRTTASEWTFRLFGRRSKGTGRRECTLFACARMPAPPTRERSIRWIPSLQWPGARTSGSMWMEPMGGSRSWLRGRGRLSGA